jgi:hypothetical protein
MKITTSQDGRTVLTVNKYELDTIFYCLGFCIGGISDEREVAAIKMIGIYESYIENIGDITPEGEKNA